MAVVVLNLRSLLVALGEVLVVVQVAGVAGDAVVVAHVDGLGHLLAGHQCLIQLLAVAGADDPDLGLAVLWLDLGVDLLERLRQRGERCCRCLLHEQVAVVAVLEGVDHQVDGVVQGHHEAGHLRVGDGDWLAFHHLLHPQGDHGAAAGHDVAVACAADGGVGTLAELAALGDGHLLHQCLGDAHGVDGVCGLVGGEDHDVPDAVLDGAEQHVVGALHIGAGGLDGEELTAGHLFERCGREYVVDAAHGDIDGLLVADVADVVLYLVVLELVAHVVLLLLVTAEDADFLDVGVQETAQHGVAETAGTTSDE